MKQAIAKILIAAVMIWSSLATAQMVPVSMWRSPNCGALSYVQGNHTSNLSGGTVSSPTITETAGNLLVVVVYSADIVPNEVFNVTDSQGNIYHAGSMYSDSSGLTAIQIFFATGITGGANVVTATAITLPHLASSVSISVAEYSGLAGSNVVDVSAGVAAVSSSTFVNPPMVTIGANCDLLVGTFSDGGTTTPSISPGSGVTTRLTDTAYVTWAFGDSGSTWKKRNSFVNAAFTESLASNTWVSAEMAFRARTTAPLPQPTQLAFATAPQTVSTGWTCSTTPVTVQLQNGSSTPTNTATGVTVTLSGASAAFFADSGCQYPINNIYIGAGTSSQSFYFMGNLSSLVISAAASGFTSITQTETVSALGLGTWIGGVGCTLWNTSLCWSGGIIPSTSTIAHFDTNCTLNCSPTIGSVVNVKGIWLHPGYAGTITQSGGVTVTVQAAYRQDAGTLASGSGGFTVNTGSFVMSGGTFTQGTGSVQVTTGSMTLTGGTFTQNGSVLISAGGLFIGGGGFAGSSATLSTGLDLVVTSGTFAGSSGVENIGRDVDIFSGGIINGNSSTITVTGNWNNAGTFTPGSSTVSLVPGNSHRLTGSTAFAKLSSATTGAVSSYTITFPANLTQTVNTTLTLGGFSSGTLSLVSSVAGVQWKLTPPPSTTLSGQLSVKDSLSPITIHAGTPYTNAGNNTNWAFP